MSEKKPSAEEIFNKTSEDMSDIERLMAEIIDEKNNGAYNVPEDNDGSDDDAEAAPYTAPAPPVRNSRTSREIDITQNTREPDKTFSDEDPDVSNGKEQKSRNRTTANSGNRKKQKTAKKTGVKVTAVILVLCAFVVIGAILFKALSEDLPQSYPGVSNTATVDNASTVSESDPENPEATLSPDIVIPTPEADTENVRIVEPGSLVLYSDTSASSDQTSDPSASAGSADTEAAQTPAVTEHSFSVYREDVSWTAAQQKCAQLGGHLANIANQQELDEIVALAEAQGLEKLWIGCHRENAALIWENDEAIEFYKWGKGEPSGYDSGDRVTEDYVLLWKFNGEWVYNDSRDDPVKDYPAMYSGQIGYVCEFGD